jgi:hypothetical protein
MRNNNNLNAIEITATAGTPQPVSATMIQATDIVVQASPSNPNGHLIILEDAAGNIMAELAPGVVYPVPRANSKVDLATLFVDATNDGDVAYVGFTVN